VTEETGPKRNSGSTSVTLPKSARERLEVLRKQLSDASGFEVTLSQTLTFVLKKFDVNE